MTFTFLPGHRHFPCRAVFIPTFGRERELAGVTQRSQEDARLIRRQHAAARLQPVAFIRILCPVLPGRSRKRTKQIVRGGVAASAIIDICTEESALI